jgi:hypothetical protein
MRTVTGGIEQKIPVGRMTKGRAQEAPPFGRTLRVWRAASAALTVVY